MDRNQITFSVIGGVFAVGAAVLGWFLYSAFSASAEAMEERDGSMDAINNYYSAKVFPSQATLAAVKTNESEFIAWRENARALAARGDRAYPPTTAPSFKHQLQNEVIRIGALPGATAGKIAAAGFLFGFDKYLGQNATMPQDGDLPKLQRQLDFISEAVTMLSKCGVAEVKAIKRDETSVKAEEEVAEPRPAAKRGKGAKGGKAEETAVASLEYELQFLAAPKAIVGVLNAFNSGLRFTVVTDFGFSQSRDLVAEKFKARDDAAEAAKNGSSRRRRGRDAEAAAAAADAGKPATVADRMVIDPEIDAPLLVTLKVKVYDFGTGVVAAEAPAAAQPAETAEPAEKATADGAAQAEPEKPVTKTEEVKGEAVE